jgi:hypothetical protein
MASSSSAPGEPFLLTVGLRAGSRELGYTAAAVETVDPNRRPPVPARLPRLARVLLGPDPRALLWLTAPTLLALLLDLLVRARALAGFAAQGKAIYASSLLVSAAFWLLPLVIACRLWNARRRPLPRVALALLLIAWILPFATLGFAGQLVYHRVFSSYMGRDTLRLGISLRGTVGEWFASWGGPWLAAAMLASGAALTAGLFALIRRVAPRLGGRIPLLPVLTFLGALVCFWTDNVDSRFLQAALPDACFVHGVVHAARMALTGQWHTGQGISVRTPAPLPPLISARAPRPNVLVVLTESVRADTLCSEPPPRCRSEALDAVAGDRIPLGRLTTQTPNTFSACVTLWTGVGPEVDFASAHSAPVLWEIARAVGYRTAYVTSQNTQYEDFGTFVSRAGIDTLVTASDLGGMADEQLGAPDERATEAMLRFVRDVPAETPYFAVLHLSNTHAPYRADPAMQPHQPHSPDPLGSVEAFRNQDRNAVLLQERTVGLFVRELRARADWDDTAVVFLSDHGEQFREHGGLYHNHSLYEEELRVPGWLIAGVHALSDAQRSSLVALGPQRTYLRDVHETVVDLLGVEDARAGLPLASLVEGRSLLRPLRSNPAALLATSTAVWEPDDARFGVIAGSRKLVGSPRSWECFDTARDPGEQHPLAASSCADLLDLVRQGFAAAR